MLARSSAPVQSRNRYFTLGWSWLARTFPLSPVQGGEGRRKREAGTSKSISHPKREIYSPPAQQPLSSWPQPPSVPLRKSPLLLAESHAKVIPNQILAKYFARLDLFSTSVTALLVMCGDGSRSFTLRVTLLQL